jgi:hypothetical protein
MRTKPHPEQGFRSCLGILRMEKTFGAQRLEAACRRGISIGAASYRSIASILKTGLDKAFPNLKVRPPQRSPGSRVQLAATSGTASPSNTR